MQPVQTLPRLEQPVPGKGKPQQNSGQDSLKATLYIICSCAGTSLQQISAGILGKRESGEYAGIQKLEVPFGIFLNCQL